jgi:hypothetical protein
MRTLFLDTESYYDSKTYTLKKMSTIEYVRDSRFRLHGVACAWDDGPITWYGAREAESHLRSLPWADIELVAHNVKHDGSILAERYGIHPARYVDTVSLAKAVLGASVPRFDLGTLAAHFKLPAKGSMQTNGLQELTEEQEALLATYCKHDVWLCRAVYDRLIVRFPRSQLGPMDWTIRCFTEPKLVINTQVASDAAVKELARREELMAASGVERGELASNQKFAALLFNSGHEVPFKPSPKTGQDIPALALGDEAFLEMLESDDEGLRLLCEARVAAKSTLLTTRATKFAAIGATGPWPFDVQFSGAKQTHRYSGGSGGGGNPQNLTRGSDLRRCVEAPAGHELIVGDFSRVECVVSAYLSGDKTLIDALAPGRDIYCEFASAYYGRTITKQDKDERMFGKTAILGLGYNMGAEKFAKRVRIQAGQVITEKAAKAVVSLYRSMYPGIPEMWKYLQSLLPTMLGGGKGELKTFPAVKFAGPKFILPSGLEVRYTGLTVRPGGFSGAEWVYKGFRDKSQTPQVINVYGGKMMENLCQALAGEICKEAIERIKGDYPTVGMVHDEIIQVAPADKAEAAVANMEKKMVVAPKWWPDINLQCEVGRGQNWLEAK